LESLKCELGVLQANSFTELLRHRQLVVVDPAFDEGHFTLLEDWLAKLKRLGFVQSDGLKEG